METQKHTPIGECTSSCRRVGCPEENDQAKDAGVYPSPLKVRKAELAEITFRELARLTNDMERLEKRLKKLEDEI